MKKMLFIIPLLFLLTSCGKDYQYNINYTLCNNSGTGNIIIDIDSLNDFPPYIQTYNMAVPALRLPDREILNVCSFTYIKTLIPN